MSNKKLSFYIGSLSFTAILCYFIAYRMYYINNLQILGIVDIKTIIAFIFLATIFESFFFKYNEIAISTGFAITTASYLYLGFFWSMVVLGVGVALRVYKLNGKRQHILNTPPCKILFNVSNAAFSIFCAGLSSVYTASIMGENILLAYFMQFAVFVFVFLIINSTTISILVSILSNSNFIKVFKNNIKYAFLNIVFIAPIGIIFCYLLINFNFLIVIALSIILLILFRFVLNIYIQ